MTDVKPMWATVHDLRDQLADALAAKAQAEDAQQVAEKEARRAEERATTAEEDRDSWVAFAHALTDEHLIAPYADDTMPETARLQITDILHDRWAAGTPIDDLDVQSIVQDYNQEPR